MPATTILYPRGFFDGGRPDDKSAFKALVMLVVAGGMDAVDPDPAKAGSRTRFAHNPPLFIDLVMLPYDPDDAKRHYALPGHHRNLRVAGPDARHR